MGIIQTATTVKKVDNTKGLKAGLCGLGGLAFAGCVLTPNQSFLTTHVVLIVSTFALMLYNVQFMLVPEMLLTQNFQVDGKVDKYHKFCCRLAGYIGTIGVLAGLAAWQMLTIASEASVGIASKGFYSKVREERDGLMRE